MFLLTCHYDFVFSSRITILIRFKTSFIINSMAELRSGFQFSSDRNDKFIKHQESYTILRNAASECGN